MIDQLKAGQCAEITSSGESIIKTYYSHYGLHNNVNACNTEILRNVIDTMMNRLLSTFDKNRRIVIPLSGDYDSRLIACLMKKYNHTNVVCYSYGISEDYEVKNLKKVAESLGFKWYYIKYDKNKWDHFFSDDEGVKEYFENVSNDYALPHIQEYMALDELMRKKVIEPGDIVIPGFCGDFPAGSFTEVIDYKIYDMNQLIEHIINYHYINFPISEYSHKIFKNKLESYFISNNYLIKDRDTFISAYEEWSICSRVTMWVVNSVRVYEHFGLDWRLPMWNKDYLSYLYSIPNTLRNNCEWYNQFLFNEYFNKYHVSMKNQNIHYCTKRKSIFDSK